MEITVFPSTLSGTIPAPASKSDFQRACAAALLYPSKTTLENPGISADELAALQLATDLGLEVISQTNEKLLLQSTGEVQPRKSAVFCGESGLATRLFIPIAALSDKAVTFSGNGSLNTRPLHFFYEMLPKLGVSVSGNNATLPIAVKGPLMPQSLTVDGSLSSQFSSGLLFAFSAAATQKEIFLKIQNPVSQPYLDMTVATLRAFGKNVFPENKGLYRILPKTEQPEKEITYTVEGDWSSAAVWMAAAALGAEIRIKSLYPKSLQADRALTEILLQTGIAVSWKKGILQVSGLPQNGFSFDLTHAPDLFPVLAVLAFSIPGESRIQGLHRLLHKESNRLQAVSQMLQKGGISFSVLKDEMTIRGNQIFNSTSPVSGFKDHRIVMAAALAALHASGPVRITDTEAVEKSYPAFFSDLKALGGKVVL